MTLRLYRPLLSLLEADEVTWLLMHVFKRRGRLLYRRLMVEVVHDIGNRRKQAPATGRWVACYPTMMFSHQALLG